ncbi:MAG: sensor histidine kinase [Candidatus Eisenbacteria bacterium]|nr:sensor histidine kinase [Candidatus Eisenbacteria bacterium]
MGESSLQHHLAERVKELTALHGTARLLQDTARPVGELMRQIVDALPDAWQYPEICGARLTLLGEVHATVNFRSTPWVQRAVFSARADGLPAEEGQIEVCYLEERPEADEGPFLREERALIDSLAEMLRMYLRHQLADRATRVGQDALERLVADRTAELQAANLALREEIGEHRRARAQIERHRAQLRRLGAQLAMAEAGERRVIAADLHDHLGQALAFIRLRLAHLAGDAMFSGFESSLEDLLTLVDRAIRYTRNLTGELSPPVLYELGLGPALDWLGEQFTTKHGLPVEVRLGAELPSLSQAARVMLWKSARELLTNVVKHARARRAVVDLRAEQGELLLSVADDGVGFEPSRAEATAASAETGTFGLFSVRERLDHLGGGFDVRSAPGAGTVVALRIPLAAVEEGKG